MNREDLLILQEFSRRIRSVFPEARIWAFGSRCGDETREHSDFDICVVLSKLDSQNWDIVSDIAWEIGFAHDVVISTTKYDGHEFEDGPISASPLVQTILREGVPA